MQADLGRLLIVDDQREFGRLLGSVAEQVGFATRILQHSLDFDFVMQHWHPNVITLEIMMPDHDGLEILGYLFDCAYPGDLIFVSRAEKSYLQWTAENSKAHGLRVAAVISKPWRRQQIVKALTPLLRQKDAA